MPHTSPAPLTMARRLRRLSAAAGLLASATLLSGCFLQPGTFDATMNVRADGRFAFSYDGEIVMAGLGGLSEMAEMAEQSGEPEPCVDDATGEERACSEDELARRAEERAQGEAMMAAMMGGGGMTDPESAAQLAATLERQKGWDRVDYVEEGVFEVSFAIQSVLGHDFDFPTIEGMPLNSAFVSARLRDDSRVRIEAPAFAAQGGGGNPFGAMMMGMAGAFGASAEGEGGPAQPPVRPISGTFRLVTDAPILANNTDEGPQPADGGQMLEWVISPATTAPPTALLQLAQ